MNTHDTPTDRPGHDDLEALLRGALQADAEQYTPDPDLEARIAERALTAPVVELPFRSNRHGLLVLGAAAAVVVALVVGAVAISRDDATTVDMTTPGSSVPGSSTPTTTAPVVTSVPPTVPTVPYPGFTVDPTTTVGPTTAPPTAMTSTTTSTPPADPGRILRTDGLGDVAFGGSTATAEQAVTARIGPPVDRFTDPACGAEQIITWGSFAIWDRGGKLTQWQLIGDATLGLTTTAGIGVGSTKGDVVAAYPGVDTGSAKQPEPPFEEVGMNGGDDSWVWVAAVAADGRVAGMVAAGTVLPEVCAGHELKVMELAPHLQGLGILPLGAPEARALAVLRAVYGPGSTGIVAPTSGCGTWAVTTFRDGVRGGFESLAVTTTQGGIFRSYVITPRADGTLPVAVPVDGVALTTGMTVAEVRTLVGDRLLFDIMAEDLPDRRPFVVHPLDYDRPRPDEPERIVGDFTGARDDDTVTAIGSGLESRC